MMFSGTGPPVLGQFGFPRSRGGFSFFAENSSLGAFVSLKLSDYLDYQICR